MAPRTESGRGSFLLKERILGRHVAEFTDVLHDFGVQQAASVITHVHMPEPFRSNGQHHTLNVKVL
jgi:hypothetical protein